VALQDFVGRPWTRASGDHSPRDRRAVARGREAWLWRVHHGPSTNRCPPPPSGRMRRSHMPRHVFLAVACGWAGILVALLAIVLVLRWLA